MNPPAGQPGYGYPPQGAPVKKSGGGKIAIIVISAVVVLFALAAFLIYRAVNANPLIGYWESAAYDDGSGRLSDEYNGEMVEGLLGIQLNSDGTAFMCSAYDAEIYDGNWTKTEDGIQINDDGSVYDFVYEHKKLYMYDEGAYIIFEKNKGDINNPSLPHGYLSGSGEDLVTMPGTNAGANLAGSGTVGNNDFYIEVIGAEPFTDIDGDDAVRVYFNFENNFSYPIDAWNALYIEAEQDGSFLDSTYSYEDVEALRFMDTKIRPGISIQCCAEFKCDFYGGEMTFTFSGYDDGYDGGTVSASYSPDNLPGAPAPYVIKPVSDPGWTLNIPGEGTLDEMYYVSVLDAELITDASGEPAIRIYYTFTNNSGDPVSFYSALSPYTYQDGLSLFMSNAANDSDTDMNAYTDINPGDTIEASCVYQLRNSSSPIEAEVEAYSSFDAVGQTYSLS